MSGFVYCKESYIYPDGVVKWMSGKYYKYRNAYEHERMVSVLYYLESEFTHDDNYSRIWFPISEGEFESWFMSLDESRDIKIENILK